MANNTPQINYFSRDFDALRTDLINFARTRHADKLAFFNDASPDIMYLEMCAYVGDMLSYYTDKTFNESFLSTAQSREALIRITSDLGFFETGTTPSQVQLTLSITVPFKADPTSGLIQPDSDYLIGIEPGMSVKADNGTSFEILEEVSFADDRNRKIIPTLDGNNQVVDYTIQKTVVAKAGETKIQRFYVSPDLAKPFLQITLDDKDITEILGAASVAGSVFIAPADDQFTDPDTGWTEVKYLTQDTKFMPVNPAPQNTTQYSNLIDPVVSLGEQVAISKRFIARRDVNNLMTLTFGSNSPSYGAFNSLINTTVDTSTVSYNQVLNNTALGEIPAANSTLFIKYRTGGGENTNVVVGQINSIVSKVFTASPSTTVASTLQAVRNSLSVKNDVPALGGRSILSNEEIRATVGKVYSTQERIVTYDDLKNLLNEMPSRFGRPFRVSYEEIKPRVANYQQVYNGLNSYLNDILAESTQAGRQTIVNDTLTFLQNIQNGIEQIDPVTGLPTTMGQLSADLLGQVPTLWIGEKARLYVLGKDENGLLVTSYKDDTGTFVSPLTDMKNNIKEFIKEKRLIGDWIDIVDGRVVNIQIEFTILVDKKNKQQVLIEALNKVRDYFNVDNWQMNQPILVSNVQTILQEINGVINVVDLKFYNIFETDIVTGRKYEPKESGRYRNNNATPLTLANNKFEMNSVNNIILQYPDSIFHCRYSDSDIIGYAITS